MATAVDQGDAFGELTALLRASAAANAAALAGQPVGPAAQALGRQLEHTLDRLALLYGRGTYENLTTRDIVESAVTHEVLLADALDGRDAAEAAARAGQLLDVARRGVRLHVSDRRAAVPRYRGIYLQPLRPEVERHLWSLHEPYLTWRDGAVMVATEAEADALRAAGDEVDVLFLDPDELHNALGRGDRQALEAELERRLTAARRAPDHVGDSRDEYVLGMLLRQSVVLRNLRDRLADGHPAAHAALRPVLDGHTRLLSARLAASAAAGNGAPPHDPLTVVIDSERRALDLAARMAADPDDGGGYRVRFQAATETGTQLVGLERLRP